MPKPTLIQTVFRKPTRKYANPNFRNPFADYDDEELYEQYRPVSRASSRYTSHMDQGVHLGYTEAHDQRYATQPGPSWQKSKRRSTVSTPAQAQESPESQRTAGTMFPKPVKRVVAPPHSRETVREANGLTEVTSSGTVKKKKKKVSAGTSEAGSTGSGLYRTPTARRANQSAPSTLVPSRDAPRSKTPTRTPNAKPIPLAFSPSTASPTSDVSPPPLPRRKPKQPSQPIAKPLETMFAPPLTPPISEKSSSHSRHRDSTSSPDDPSVPPPLPSRPNKSPRRSRDATPVEVDDDQDVFYTPRTSADPDSARSTMVEPPTSAGLAPPGPPEVMFQPPTPAEEREEPFESEQESSLSSSLHPNDRARDATPRRPRDSVQSPTPKSRRTKRQALPEEPMPMEEDAGSVTGEIGEEDQQDMERRRVSPSGNSRAGSSRSSPNNDHGSRAPSVSRSQGSNHSQSKSRASQRGTTYDDFVVHRQDSYARSEASVGGRSAREGSVKSGVSGYGKGGWAAAAASRSGAASPVGMYMPSGGNDGWAEFQPPPRKSKFTPLPTASQPQTFDRLVHGTQAPGSEEELDQSYPSSYESAVSEDDLPLPSRSYARQDQGSPAMSLQSSNSDSPSEAPVDHASARRQLHSVVTRSSGRVDEDIPHEPEALSRWHQDTLRRLLGMTQPPPPPPAPLGLPGEGPDLYRQDHSSPNLSAPNDGRYPRPSSRRSQTAPSQSSIYDSMPHTPHTHTERPMSPAMSVDRPSSRVGFEAPSLLNPDTITLLPEMSVEDSAKTYEPSEPSRPPSRRAVSVKRSTSVFSAASKASKAESTDYEDEKLDVVGELPPIRRVKSGVSFRNGNSADWEGSSSGEGVLLESHGRDSENAGGYTGLILPLGAYKPADPSKSVSEINARILGMPNTNMAAITLATLPSRDTPLHLRSQNPPVDFTSYVRPPTKVGNGQLLVQIYATAVDEWDIKALDDKTKADVHKWVPGRSFVGRCLSVGGDEKDIVRGEIVVGLMDIKKSGALAEYMLCDRRRLARAPYPTSLTLEQLSLLPLQGIPAARLVRSALVRNSRALLMDAHCGVSALVCQEMSRGGVNVTALIAGGDEHHDAQTACMTHGARGVLTGSPAAVMLSLDEGGWDFILDTKGGQRVYDAAKRILKNGGRLITTVKFDPSMPSNQPLHPRSGGFKALRAAFGSKKKDARNVSFEYLSPGGTGEPEVDSSGMDCRDVLEEAAMVSFRPVVKDVFPLELGAEAFKPVKGPHVSIVRLAN